MAVKVLAMCVRDLFLRSLHSRDGLMACGWTGLCDGSRSSGDGEKTITLEKLGRRCSDGDITTAIRSGLD